MSDYNFFFSSHLQELLNVGAREFAILNGGPRRCLRAIRLRKELRGDKCEEGSLTTFCC
jgi:hypothetical protein